VIREVAPSNGWFIVEIMKQIGFVVAAAAFGIITWGLCAGVLALVKSGALNDASAYQAGQTGARYALNLGGSIGALIGAWFSASRSDGADGRVPGLAGWITAGVLVLFFVAAGLGAK
jgi:hypothetical protein